MTSAKKLLIQNGIIVTCKSTAPFEGVSFKGDLLVENGIISKIDTKISLDGLADVDVIDATNKLVVPGFIDTHRHVWEGAYKWMGDWTLFEYMAKTNFLLANRVEAEDAYISQLVGNLEALNAGITSIVDHSHLSSSEAVVDSIVDATKKSGIRSFFCYARMEAFSEAFSGGTPNKEWQMAQIKRLASELAGSDRITLGLAIDPVNDAFYDDIKNELFPLADEHGIDIFSTHYVGGPNGFGAGGSHAFASRGLLDNKSILFVHATSLEPSEYENIKKSNSGVSVTPEVDQGMALGRIVGFTAEDAGIRVGLGVDCSTVVGGDMFAVMRSMLTYQRRLENDEYLQRGELPIHLKRKAQDVFRMATIGGARAIRREHEIGSLEVGKKADIQLLDLTSPSMLGAERNPFQAIVLHATVADINKVIVGGEVLVDRSQPSSAGVFTKVNWSEEVKKAHESLERIRSKFQDWEGEEEQSYTGLRQGMAAMGLKFAA
ncbi:hypothetical protein FRC03_007146 [Tulasnella sp. 419]|nr:hypothetical protein FRC03_007146 [Tulasnella sp. 419]